MQRARRRPRWEYLTLARLEGAALELREHLADCRRCRDADGGVREEVAYCRTGRGYIAAFRRAQERLRG